MYTIIIIIIVTTGQKILPPKGMCEQKFGMEATCVCKNSSLFIRHYHIYSTAMG